MDRPLAAFLGATLLLRVLTDDMSAPDSRQSGALNLSAGIAVIFILLAGVLLLLRRRGRTPTLLAALWLVIWTAIAVGTKGASSETLREGVREGSIVALAVIVYNARHPLPMPLVTRIIQLAATVPAFASLYQLATDTGLKVDGSIRANGTFAHPNSAAVFFAVAAAASFWRYLDSGRLRSDAALVVLFAAALLATFSIDGLATLVVMLGTLGALRPGSIRGRLEPWALAGIVVVAFFATPLGANRIAKESSTNIASAEHNEANSTLSWRLYKWKTLLPAWEKSPVVGQGLGTTVTEEAVANSEFAGDLPHNEYIRYLVESGIVGLTFLLGALALLIRSLIRIRRLDGSGLGASSLALAVVIGYLVNALADNTLLYSAASYAAVLIVVSALSRSTVREGMRAT